MPRDAFGMPRAFNDRTLPLLVAAMAFLAALALAGAIGADHLAQHWQSGAGVSLTVQVPEPEKPAESGSHTRLDRALALLRAMHGVVAARPLSEQELRALIRPWLGDAVEHLSLPLPAVIEVRFEGEDAPLEGLGHRLDVVAPGTLVESHSVWIDRLSALARSLRASAALALSVVALVAAAVIAVATRARLLSRQDAIEIVHSLGATDGYIARRFAARATLLAGVGGLAGALAAFPVLLGLSALSAPFASLGEPVHTVGDIASVLPPVVWLGLPCLPVATAFIGYVAADGAVRQWLRRLP